jgi:hypothetical protein
VARFYVLQRRRCRRALRDSEVGTTCEQALRANQRIEYLLSTASLRGGKCAADVFRNPQRRQ